MSTAHCNTCACALYMRGGTRSIHKLTVLSLAAAISEHHVQAPSQYAGSSVASLSSKDIGSEHGNISDGSGSERGRHEIERFGNGSERDGMETDSGAGVFGGEEGGDHVSAVSARSTDTHSSPRPGNGKGGVSHGEGIVGGDDELFIAGHKGKARGVGGGGNVAVGIHASANTSEGKSTSGRRDAEFVKESIQREGERGDARRDEEDGGLFVGENNKVVVSMESVGSDTLLSARQWVQLRKPWRVEARLLDLERAHAKVLQQDHLIDKELHAGAESNPVHTRSEGTCCCIWIL